jgi:hypothetical protein
MAIRVMEALMEEKHVDSKQASTNLSMSINHISEHDLVCLKSDDAPEILVTDLRSLPIVQTLELPHRKN